MVCRHKLLQFACLILLELLTRKMLLASHRLQFIKITNNLIFFSKYFSHNDDNSFITHIFSLSCKLCGHFSDRRTFLSIIRIGLDSGLVKSFIGKHLIFKVLSPPSLMKDNLILGITFWYCGIA